MLDNTNKEIINDLKSEIKDHEEEKQLLQNQLNEKVKFINELEKDKKNILESIARIVGKNNSSDFKINLDIIVQKLNNCFQNQKLYNLFLLLHQKSSITH